MLKSLPFILYAAFIPVVPLYGTMVYSREKHNTKRLVCWVLFAVQSLISLLSIISYTGQA